MSSRKSFARPTIKCSCLLREAKEAGSMTLEERIELYLEEKARQEGQGR